MSDPKMRLELPELERKKLIFGDGMESQYILHRSFINERGERMIAITFIPGTKMDYKYHLQDKLAPNLTLIREYPSSYLVCMNPSDSHGTWLLRCDFDGNPATWAEDSHLHQTIKMLGIENQAVMAANVHIQEVMESMTSQPQRFWKVTGQIQKEIVKNVRTPKEEDDSDAYGGSSKQ